MALSSRLLRALLPLLLAAGAGGRGWALEPAPTLTRYVHDVWTLEDGLPQVSVVALAQTSEGYLWLGTQEGLVRFDGMQFRVYDRGNTPALPHNYVLALHAGRSGELWIGTYGGGLARWHQGSIEKLSSAQGLPNDVVWALAEWPGHGLAVGTAGGLALVVDGRVKRVYRTADGLPADAVLALWAEPGRGLWLGTASGLAWLDEQESAPVMAPGLPREPVRALHGDGEGGVWIGTHGHGLWHRGGGQGLRRYGRSEGLDNEFVWSLFQDRHGALWIGTDGGGLARWSGGRFVSLSKPQGLSSDVVRALREDREGSLWIGTYGGGLNRLRDGALSTRSTLDGLSHDVVAPLLEDRTGALWVGTAGGGLNRVQGERNTHFGRAHGLPSDAVVALCEDRTGRLWVGAGRGGLLLFSGGRFVRRRLPGIPDHTTVRAIADDTGGRLWVGTDGRGLVRLDPGGGVRHFGLADGLGSDTVFALRPDPQRDVMWVGTEAGLARVDGQRVTRYGASEGLRAGGVFDVHLEADGSLWLATGGAGLVRWRSEAAEVFDAQSGLPTDTIYRVLDDGRGHLWLSSNRGIVRVARAELLAPRGASGRPELHPVIYGRVDGMRSRECNGRFQPAGWAARDGSLYFPTMKGVVRVEPERAAREAPPPAAWIEGLSVERRELAARPGLRLAPGTTRIELRYTALGLAMAETLRFRYRLLGVDPGWVEAGSSRVASYTHVPPGVLRFEVTACNREDRCHLLPAALVFERLPRFRETLAFGGLCTAGVLLAGWLLLRFRLRLLQARAAVLDERNRLAQEIHDTLAQGLSGIVLQLEALRRSLGGRGTAEAQVERIAQLARHNLDEARRPIWALRPPRLAAGDLPRALALTVEQWRGTGEVELQLELRGTPRPLPERLESGLFRVAQEALGNAVRHAGARRIQVLLAYEPWGALRLAVADDGRGLELEGGRLPVTGGRGLTGMRERVRGLGGRFRLSSTPGCGLTVEAYVPCLRCAYLAWRARARAWLGLAAREPSDLHA